MLFRSVGGHDDRVQEQHRPVLLRGGQRAGERGEEGRAGASGLPIPHAVSPPHHLSFLLCDFRGQTWACLERTPVTISLSSPQLMLMAVLNCLFESLSHILR